MQYKNTFVYKSIHYYCSQDRNTHQTSSTKQAHAVCVSVYVGMMVKVLVTKLQTRILFNSFSYGKL